MEDNAPKHVIQMTGFKMEEKEALGKLLLKLDCTFIKSEKYKNCTHLIAERLCKSEKFLAACAAGKWVLTKDYIIHSANSGRWLDETTYEWGYKIEKDSHFSPQMQSAPKRWREELKRTGAPGAFHRWKVVLLVRADKRSDSLLRVLEAGKANVILPKSSPTGITHVIASNARINAEKEKDNFKAPFYPIQYLGDFLLEKEMQNHDEDVIVSSAVNERHKRAKFRETRDLKFLKMRNTLGSHTYGNQKETTKKNEDIQRSYTLRKKLKKEIDCKKDFEHDRIKRTLRKHVYYTDQKEMNNSVFTDYAKESKPKDIRKDMDISEIKNVLRKHIYRAQAVRYNCIRIEKQPVYNAEVKNAEFPRGILNLIESLIEGQFFKEAMEELSSLQAHYIPPVCLLHALLDNVLQDNIDTFSGRYFDILSALLRLHPPWKSPAMSRYYLELFQCPNCTKGAWSLVEALIRSCLFNENFCHEISQNITDSKVLHLTLLKFFFNLVESEVQHLSQKLYDCSESHGVKITGKAVLHEIFWSGNETSGLLTKPVNMLLEWTIYSYKEKCKSDDVFKHELTYLLTGILGATVDYWIFLGLKMGRNVMRHLSDDFGSYISLACDDFSSRELEIFICSFSSSWLQMFVAEAVFKKLCLQSSIGISSEPLSLQKMVYSYLPALGKTGVHRAGKVHLPKKTGQRSCLESQRALLMLNGAKRKPVEGPPRFPELNLAKCSPSLKKFKKKSEGESPCSKENCPNLKKMNIHKTNLKGETALHRACISNKVDKLILLLSLPGIDINVKDNAGWTPLHEACNYGNTVCVQEILQRCPEVDLLTQVDGVTPLHDALSNGHVEIGKLLLQHGGPLLLQQRNSKGELPLDYVLSPQIKEELFAITKIEDTVENFHVQAEKHFYHQQLEFGSFLLSRMLLNFCSIFDLSSEFILAFKGLTHLNELLMAYKSYKETTSTHTDWLLDLYDRNIRTLKKLPNILKELPEHLKLCPGVHTEALLVTLEMMCRSVTDLS
ncbi:SMC5-SMC6 complex localization factor protein 1 isoform X1 [Heterocephalus glaber]|uniref:SMC5-SMC6 complex localization factor protein 1 n=1 Tax=Heterocephalus glaber TaxID=10181 RepID=A0AAX6SQY0_HETGA|nr:SMC5-SMC6 complex localization factor protein 1 isoform X1 [Heterocephalus glaber]XP_021111437.1 SMC5-SMC6 complex localization factor protein 1 isoform X1 [Heterocephalus glaber]